MRWLQSTIVLLFPILTTCTAVAGAGGSERVEAAQKALDLNSPLAPVADGYQCPGNLFGHPPPTKYIGMPGAHVGPVVMHDPSVGSLSVGHDQEPCRLVSWDADVPLRKGLANVSQVPIGHYVLDKLGEDQQQMGVTYAPLRAHFEISKLGEVLIADHLASPPSPKIETSVTFDKDADGHTRASLLSPITN